MKRIFEILGIIFNHSFWRDFIAADIIQEGRMMHEYDA